MFFAPLELTRAKDDVNGGLRRRSTTPAFPVVLLDRTVVPYPRRGHHDLVGIDNRRAGYVITEHLLRLGARRLAFVALAHAAATVGAREAGYREALYTWGAPVDPVLVHRLDPDNADTVRQMMDACRPDGVVCANDRTAARLMQTLLRLDYQLPRDVRLVGIDDADYAPLLPVPLTTLRQPSRQIGDAALGAMLDRLARRDLPTRDILLHCELIVRKSCGAGASPTASRAGRRCRQAVRPVNCCDRGARDCSNGRPSAVVSSPRIGRASLWRNTPPGASMAVMFDAASASCRSSKYGRMLVAITRSNGAAARRSVTMSSGSARRTRVSVALTWTDFRSRPSSSSAAGRLPAATRDGCRDRRSIRGIPART